MLETGLSEVKNPGLIFLSDRENNTPGSVVAASVEGTRPLLIEVQALVTHSNFGYPQRVSNGFDQKRLSILLAVIEKRGGYKISANNVFLNMTGGVRIDEPAIDLAVCCSIISSLLDRPIDSSTVIIGEVGLGGEIRSVTNVEKRIIEAEKLDFKRVVIPAKNHKNINPSNIKIIPVVNLNEAVTILLK
jgi:DNA repair protein RadA/Sms